SKWSFLKLWNYALDGLFSFTVIPLKIWTYFGLIIALMSFIYGCYLVVKTLIFGVVVPGYVSLMVSILFVNGFLFVSIGICGEYIARIYREVKQRPLYIVARKKGFEEKEN
ncbi:MAG: glycosyltransferase, partial [Rickettsiales bacterium]|nr:glycosyltransferase [Rickettsiales bacterium]